MFAILAGDYMAGLSYIFVNRTEVSARDSNKSFVNEICEYMENILSLHGEISNRTELSARAELSTRVDLSSSGLSYPELLGWKKVF